MRAVTDPVDRAGLPGVLLDGSGAVSVRRSRVRTWRRLWAPGRYPAGER